MSLLEGSSLPSDLPTKYQKLAAEYAKIRSQFGLLKKAVIDEQNQSAELKEILRTKDQNLRKAEQELDSLNFRNQQLTKRITILQDDLNAAQSTPKSKHKGHSADSKNSVIVEELQQKIAENAKLVSTLQEETDRFENEKFKLNQKIESYEHYFKEYQLKLSLLEGTKLATIENENKTLQSKLDAKIEEVQKLHKEIRQLKSDLSGKNLVIDNASLKDNTIDLFKNLVLQDLLVSISQFFHQLEITLKQILEEEQFKKFVDLNKKNRLFLQDFIDKYLLCYEKDTDETFLSICACICNDIQHYIIVLEELTSCINPRQTDNLVFTFEEILCNIKNHWIQLNSILSKFSLSNSSSLESEELFSNFTDIFRSLRGTCDYFLSKFNENFKSYSNHTESDKEILEILTKMSLLSSTIYRKLSDNAALMVKIINTQIFKIKQKAALSQSENCCESWKQEIELLKAIHSKEVKDLEEQISCLSEAISPRSTNSVNVIRSFEDDKVTVDANEFDSMTKSDVPVVGEEVEYVKFFNARANKLVADRQFAESRVTVYKEECEVLQKRLSHSLEARLLLEDSLKQSQNTINKLQEELQTTTLNYEVQLQSMSEHMANMNEKLASQQEEIEVLKHELLEKFQKRKVN